MDFDTELLGLKYELVDFLSDRDFCYFSDFTDVDVCMSEHEIKVTILTEYTNEFAKVFSEWAKLNKFIVSFIEETSKVKLRRKGVAN